MSSSGKALILRFTAAWVYDNLVGVHEGEGGGAFFSLFHFLVWFLCVATMIGAMGQ